MRCSTSSGSEPDVIEQSKILNRRLSPNLTLLADSKENGFIMFAEQDASDIFCYRYYNQGNERLQSAWFRWNIIGDLQYHSIMGDNWYGVVVEEDAAGTEIISLLNMDLSEGSVLQIFKVSSLTMSPHGLLL